MVIQDRVARLASLYKGHLHKGKQIVDEKCSCQHYRSEHADLLDVGHGVCSYPDCKCKQFTWVGWITKK